LGPPKVPSILLVIMPLTRIRARIEINVSKPGELFWLFPGPMLSLHLMLFGTSRNTET
jgi:hypothetical protein